jgi:hypothetical protein
MGYGGNQKQNIDVEKSVDSRIAALIQSLHD